MNDIFERKRPLPLCAHDHPIPYVGSQNALWENSAEERTKYKGALRSTAHMHRRGCAPELSYRRPMASRRPHCLDQNRLSSPPAVRTIPRHSPTGPNPLESSARRVARRELNTHRVAWDIGYKYTAMGSLGGRALDAQTSLATSYGRTPALVFR
ncbi:hypothetical protein BD413DRAFT_34602 [Trametes elegans]|nr:hypothetical protein BD413DRAFT_34602 [Trametes elegans]